MARWQDAIQTVPTGVRLLVEVSANALHAEFPAGFNPWRGRIGIRVRAPAQEGRANGEVVATVAAHFGVPSSRVVLESGARDARKSLRVEGLRKDQVEGLLQGRLETP